jgi:hypothetical protein
MIRAARVSLPVGACGAYASRCDAGDLSSIGSKGESTGGRWRDNDAGPKKESRVRRVQRWNAREPDVSDPTGRDPIDLDRIRTVPLDTRPSLVETSAFGRVSLPGAEFQKLLDAIPRVHAGLTFRTLVDAVARAHRGGRPVILGMGAHVIKVGLSPQVIDLLERGIVTAVAMNGAGAIHDYEIATAGKSSEDVGKGLEDGSFGMARETGVGVNGAAADAARAGIGFGRAVGERILKEAPRFANLSILAACARLGRPATVHVAIGSDIVHMHANADGAAIGAATMHDFRVLAGVVAGLTGGVYLNLGSAVVLPEVFVKALNLARNLGHDVQGFTTANMDQIRHYRPRVNVLDRPGGRSLELVGHHEMMFPLLRLAVLDALGVREGGGGA